MSTDAYKKAFLILRRYSNSKSLQSINSITPYNINSVVDKFYSSRECRRRLQQDEREFDAVIKIEPTPKTNTAE